VLCSTKHDTSLCCGSFSCGPQEENGKTGEDEPIRSFVTRLNTGGDGSCIAGGVGVEDLPGWLTCLGALDLPRVARLNAGGASNSNVGGGVAVKVLR